MLIAATVIIVFAILTAGFTVVTVRALNFAERSQPKLLGPRGLLQERRKQLVADSRNQSLAYSERMAARNNLTVLDQELLLEAKKEEDGVREEGG